MKTCALFYFWPCVTSDRDGVTCKLCDPFSIKGTSQMVTDIWVRSFDSSARNNHDAWMKWKLSLLTQNALNMIGHAYTSYSPIISKAQQAMSVNGQKVPIQTYPSQEQLQLPVRPEFVPDL